MPPTRWRSCSPTSRRTDLPASSSQGRAVFLSYASEDAVAAEKVCASLRSAGIEVWFDKSELRGGDAWDATIRQQIKACTLFVPVISRNSQTRGEGYFRLEWKLAVDRSHLMAADQPFLVPIVIDETADAAARVPDRFRELQWTRLPGGETPSSFVQRVARLLQSQPAESAPPAQPAQYVGTAPAPSPVPAAAAISAAPANAKPAVAASRSKTSLLATIAVVFLVLAFVIAYLVVNRGLVPHQAATAKAEPGSAMEGAPTPVTAFNPPPHSIAVLPFANISGDQSQEYFSDGLTEELLNSLSAVNGLQVAARTSAFSFKGTNTDIGTIARKLNVGAVLEGGVRRSAHTIRITAQLINAVTGFNTWSKTYDRDTGDVLKLQTEIATEVASALQVTLLGDVAATVELGGTSNPAAFDAYLRGAKAEHTVRDTKDLPAAIGGYSEAIRLDPHYALAFAARSLAFSNVGTESEIASVAREAYGNARADARQALALAPDLAQAHLALAFVSDNTLDFPQADAEYARALTLAPGNAQVLRISGPFAVYMGRLDAGVAAARRAVVLDPLNHRTHGSLGQALYYARRYQDALMAFAESIDLDPNFKQAYGQRGLSFYGLGDFADARSSCEAQPDYWFSQQCLALVYDKLGRHADAEAILTKLKAFGDNAAYQIATVYAQWGDRAQALEWLATAWRLRDPGLLIVKTDPLLDPLRQEPRFQAIERELDYPK